MLFPGCYEETPNCTYWFRGTTNLSMETGLRPPCCTKLLLGLLDYTLQMLDEMEIVYWLDFGTLLGAYRTGEFIPWDGDIDITVIDKHNKIIHEIDRESSMVCQFRNEGEDIKNWNVNPSLAAIPEIIRLQVSNTNKLHVDLFTCVEKDKSTLYRPNRRSPLMGGRRGFKKSFIDPLEKITIYDRQVNCPNNLDKYLNLIYGMDFLTPKRTKPDWSLKTELI